MIVAARKADKRLTYSSIAIELGRDPKGGPRYVGQVCNKLDAAAALAGVPVLALDVVHTKGDEVNPKAMPRAADYRQKIIERAKAHEWTEDDFAALGLGANQLLPLGRKKAWNHVRTELGGVVAAYRQLAGIDPSTFILKDGRLQLRQISADGAAPFP
jgi:hypothetical protein